MPLMAHSSNISDFSNGSELFKIVEGTIERLEGRYGNRVQFNSKWKIELLTDQEVQERWCNFEKDVEKCLRGRGVEAFYEVRTGTIILQKTLSLDKAFDVGSIIHEVTHYVQHKYGLTGSGSYNKCIPWLEYDATLIEKELIKKSGLYIPSWYIEHMDEWIETWENKLNSTKTDCKEQTW